MTAASPLHLLNSADENYNNFCQALVRGYPEYLRSSGLITYNKICQDLVDEANKRIFCYGDNIPECILRYIDSAYEKIFVQIITNKKCIERYDSITKNKMVLIHYTDDYIESTDERGVLIIDDKHCVEIDKEAIFAYNIFLNKYINVSFQRKKFFKLQEEVCSKQLHNIKLSDKTETKLKTDSINNRELRNVFPKNCEQIKRI